MTILPLDPPFIKTFEQAGRPDFAAMDEAVAWCRTMGISVGAMQARSPRGLLFGEFTIMKWRNLSRATVNPCTASWKSPTTCG